MNNDVDKGEMNKKKSTTARRRVTTRRPTPESGDAEKEVTILTYVDRSFEKDLTFIDGLVKTRSRLF